MASEHTYPSASEDRVEHVSRLLREAEPPPLDGDVRAVVVPHMDNVAGGRLTARVLKAVEGSAYSTVIVVASGSGVKGRIHVSRRESYPSTVGDFEVDLEAVDELCDEDDDIFADDRGHFVEDGIAVQLPFLKQALGGFRLVPVIMGDESPEYCRELGAAMGEVMYGKSTLVVACVDVLGAAADDLDSFRRRLEAGDVDAVMHLANSERVLLDGRGPLIAAMLAARHRNPIRVDVLELAGPSRRGPGRLGAVLTRN